jgi:hypothetical protein
MDDTDALIGTSSYASEVLSEIFDGWHLIKTSRKSELPAVLHRIEASAECLADALDDYGPAFALAAPPWPVKGDNEHTASSVHILIQECGMMIRVVSLAIHRAADPQRYPRGVEHICPDLPSEDEIRLHIDEAIEAYKVYLPSVYQLNWMGAAKEQELARALENVCGRKFDLDAELGKVMSVLTDPERILVKAIAESRFGMTYRELAGVSEAFQNGEIAEEGTARRKINRARTAIRKHGSPLEIHQERKTGPLIVRKKPTKS